MKFTRYVMLAAALIGLSAKAQTIDTIASSNVTAWAAQLHGGYSALSTAEVYTLSFAYGKTDGGTNLGSWAFQSGSVVVSSGSTGSFSRTIVELEGTNTYYFRGLAETTNSTLWATQSLSFVTAGNAPTSTPPVQYLAVMVDTDGVLIGPTNFFLINGILPTQSVQAITVNIESNAYIAQLLLSNAVRKTADGGIHIPPRSNTIYSVSTPLFFHHIGGTMNTTNSFHMWWNGTDLYGATSGVYGATVGKRFWTDFNASSLLTDLLPTMSIIDALSITNREAWGYYASGDNIVGTTLSTPSGIMITNRGSNTLIDYKGFGNLVVTYGGATQAVFSGASVQFPRTHRVTAGSVTATNDTSYFGNSYFGVMSGNGLLLSNVPLSAIQSANSYTGGVMAIKTTDGQSLFFE